MLKNQRNSIGSLRAVLLGAAATAVLALPAFGQAGIETVTVTGTLIQGNTNLVSPVTVIDTSTLDKSGISSIQGALQQTLANNGPAVTNSWTANGNFAQGASGISLRALTTNSTLVMFDGMRAAYYPLADDGIRNFVDLNTISDDIVENIQILRDGASSSYGADAIAGVVNIVTKREFQGFSARAEAGINEKGVGAEWKMSVTAGVGDLGKDHVNFYLSAAYQHSDVVYSHDLPYPFNTRDWSGICYDDPVLGKRCGADRRTNGTNKPTFSLSTGGNFMVRPYNYDPTTQQITTPVTGSRYQNLSGCGPGTLITLTAAQQGARYPSQVCQYDNRNLFGVTDPAITRFSLAGHSAFVLPHGIDGYVEANFMQDSVGYYSRSPEFVSTEANTGIYYPQYDNSTPENHIFLPVYICAERTNCDTAADRRLNPQNPFASAGQAAYLFGADWTHRAWNSTRDRTYRVAGELNGSLFSDWKWNVGFTVSHIDLQRKETNQIYIQHLLDVVADGNYNFIDPTKNDTPLAALNGLTANQYLMPDNIHDATSDLAQAKFSVTAPLYALPGGDLTVVAGATIFYEAVDAPSENSDINGPTMRYFTPNAFGTKGSRDVYAGFFEINIPIIEEFVINASGRYDSYSSGQSNFSPKIGFWSRPIDSVTFKGTYSEGFRIPSFAEANAYPTTGFVSNSDTMFNDAYLAHYNCSLATFSSACPAYINSASYGMTTVATPNLQPEKSRSWVFDLTYAPVEELSVGVTYYNIKKTGAIANLDCTAAISAYYDNPTNPSLPAGCTIIRNAPDVNFPLAPPTLAFIRAPLVNANAIRTAGWDFNVTYDTDIGGFERMLGVEDTLGTIHMNTGADATFIQNLDTKFTSGRIERYDGTLGNYNLTSGSGTPKWRGKWQTTLSGGDIEFTSTLNWTSGYNVSAMDQGDDYRDCGQTDHARPCRTSDYFTWDANTQYKLNDNLKLYFTVNNVLDAMPPVDTKATYGSSTSVGYNAVIVGDNILGRYYKLGIKLDY